MLLHFTPGANLRKLFLSLSLIRLSPGPLSPGGLAQWYYQIAASRIISLWGRIRSTKILSTIQFIVLCLLKPSVGSVEPQFCLVRAVTEVSISVVLLYTVLYSPTPQWLGFVQVNKYLVLPCAFSDWARFRTDRCRVRTYTHPSQLTHYPLNPYRVHTCFIMMADF
jgi:hypothetical protein